jgi:hypothetical protein
VAADRVLRRAVRPLHTLRRLPRDDWPVCWEYPRCRAVYSECVGDVGGWEKECGVTCLESISLLKVLARVGEGCQVS